MGQQWSSWTCGERPPWCNSHNTLVGVSHGGLVEGTCGWVDSLAQGCGESNCKHTIVLLLHCTHIYIICRYLKAESSSDVCCFIIAPV